MASTKTKYILAVISWKKENLQLNPTAPLSLWRNRWKEEEEEIRIDCDSVEVYLEKCGQYTLL